MLHHTNVGDPATHSFVFVMTAIASEVLFLEKGTSLANVRRHPMRIPKKIAGKTVCSPNRSKAYKHTCIIFNGAYSVRTKRICLTCMVISSPTRGIPPDVKAPTDVFRKCCMYICWWEFWRLHISSVGHMVCNSLAISSGPWIR